jgi:hypothetical protein
VSIDTEHHSHLNSLSGHRCFHEPFYRGKVETEEGDSVSPRANEWPGSPSLVLQIPIWQKGQKTLWGPFYKHTNFSDGDCTLRV